MPLSIAEEIVLLGLDDRQGKYLTYYLKYALSGALVADLIVAGLVRIQRDTVVAAEAAGALDDVHRESLAAIARAPGKKLHDCVSGALADHQQERVLGRLLDAGVVEQVQHRALGLFPYRRYPTADPLPEDEVRARLRAAVLTHVAVEPRTQLLLSIAHACGLTKTFLSQEERESCAARVVELTDTEPVGQAVRKAIADDETAAAVLMIAAAP
jgi:hypothetical protein